MNQFDFNIINTKRRSKTFFIAFIIYSCSINQSIYQVNYLYSDLCDGLIIFQLMDFIKPGIVDWRRVKTLEKMSRMAAKRLQEVLGNCNYAVELGKKLNFSLVGIAGL